MRSIETKFLKLSCSKTEFHEVVRAKLRDPRDVTRGAGLDVRACPPPIKTIASIDGKECETPECSATQFWDPDSRKPFHSLSGRVSPDSSGKN